jgi:modulator of drug activity B
MTNILLINGHQPFPSSSGSLNAAFFERAEASFIARGNACRIVKTVEEWDLENEIQNQLWADLIFLQFPLNSMGTPWSLKRYLDEVYTAGMDGRLAKGDGRTRTDPTRQYCSGGCMQDTAYTLSVTMNAPREAFDDPAMNLFGGRSVDELLAPVHINFAFFELRRLPTFCAFDVNKNPTIEADFDRFDIHLNDLKGTYM